MAYVAKASTTVLGAVAGESITEGRLVVLVASGLHKDLPTARLATTGDTNVFVAMVPPDNFPRPTKAGFYTTTDQSTLDIDNAAALTTTETVYRIMPSLLENPVAASGWKLQLHKGGVYTIPSDGYTDSDNIRKAGSPVKLTTSGKLVLADSVTDSAVGYVREYRDGFLTFQLDDRIS